MEDYVKNVKTGPAGDCGDNQTREVERGVKRHAPWKQFAWDIAW